VKFVHLSDWPGYKSGALNYALEHMVDGSCELIGVIDSDYQIEPQFLRRCAPLFADENVGFIQAPQDYRDWQNAPFYRGLYYSYHYFFVVSQPSRNERDDAIAVHYGAARPPSSTNAPSSTTTSSTSPTTTTSTSATTTTSTSPTTARATAPTTPTAATGSTSAATSTTSTTP